MLNVMKKSVKSSLPQSQNMMQLILFILMSLELINSYLVIMPEQHVGNKLYLTLKERNISALA